MYNLKIVYTFLSLFPLTVVAENIFFLNNWVICRTTLEIREQMGNQFSVDQLEVH